MQNLFTNAELHGGPHPMVVPEVSHDAAQIKVSLPIKIKAAESGTFRCAGPCARATLESGEKPCYMRADDGNRTRVFSLGS